ncbi:glycosyltransferase 39-like [Kipferlia bialata]|uniref:Glycosyltransferase 39-like n=1 Tax=Kipferlia bialata TaxID=797122 RepID=A0A9K3GJ25_9EUKA|nr:glycosyltransferase 39-like [Kipferlia bialata]|eukprot:g5626.t1
MISRVVLGLLCLLVACLCEEENHVVSYYSGVRLQSRRPDLPYFLHSHDVTYGAPDNRYSVTASEREDDTQNMWQIFPDPSKSGEKGYTLGDALICGDNVTLLHSNSARFLTTDPSRVSMVSKSMNKKNAYEIYADGSIKNEPEGALWRVECVGGKTEPCSGTHRCSRDGKAVTTGTQVKFVHDASGAALQCTNHKYGHPLQGQLEVVSQKSSTSSAADKWKIAAGWFFDQGMNE